MVRAWARPVRDNPLLCVRADLLVTGCGLAWGPWVGERPDKTKAPKRMLRGLLVAPTGVDPVTFRFSVERSTN